MIKIKTQIIWFINLILLTSLCACGGGSSNGSPDNTPPPPSITPVDDISPDPFQFISISNAEPSKEYESRIMTITGINTDTDISIKSGEYSLNDNAYSSQTGKVKNNDKVKVRLTASSSYNSQVSASLTIGDHTATFSITTGAEPVTAVNIDFNLNTQHIVGDKETFERSKFITLHASHTESDWYNVGVNKDDNLVTNFVTDYDVYFGRDTGMMAWQLGQLPESTMKPGYVDADRATEAGSNIRWKYSNDENSKAITQRALEHRNPHMVVAAQQHPYWPDGKLTKSGWAFSMQDTQDEPFGTATGNYMGLFVGKYFNKGDGVDIYGQPKPKYVEVMNEPLYDLVDATDTPTNVEKVFHFHNGVADAIRAIEYEGSRLNDNVLIGGYTAAFPDFDKQDFAQWLDRDKAFIDIAGEKMDFISIHLYDFPNFSGKEMYRKGSNMEATMDLLTAYTEHKFGQSKPLLISEYGSQVHGLYNQPWSPYRDWFLLKATNSMLMSFLERPDQIEMAIPFITVKAEWGRVSDDVPYYWRLMRQQHEADGENGDLWVYTDLVKFYQLWANVNGKRIETYSKDQDILVDAYVDNNKAYLIINSLEFEDTEIKTNLFGLNNNTIKQVLIKHLFLENQAPVMNEISQANMPDTFVLGAEGTVIFEVEFDNPIELTEQVKEEKHFVHSDIKSISANHEIEFTINNVELAEDGYAILRLGINRPHGLSLRPDLFINDTFITVPEDFRGYDQFHSGKGREQFYGVIEIEVSREVLAAENTIKMTFPDSGGYLVSKGLQVFNATTALKRSN